MVVCRLPLPCGVFVTQKLTVVPYAVFKARMGNLAASISTLKMIWLHTAAVEYCWNNSRNAYSRLLSYDYECTGTAAGFDLAITLDDAIYIEEVYSLVTAVSADSLVRRVAFAHVSS